MATIAEYAERLERLAREQRKIVRAEAQDAKRLAEEEVYDKAAEHVQRAVEAEAQAGAFDQARALLRQMKLVQS